MTALPSVEPLPPDTVPTEPGWYVTGDRQILEVWRDPRGSDVLYAAGVYWDGAMLVSELTETFIARIYPDRIGQE